MYPKFLLTVLFSGLLMNGINAQTIELNSNREKLFAFEVKHIDEFMERFNYEKNSLIISYVMMNYPGVAIDRGALITNLFNRQNKNWYKPDVDSFFNQVNNKEDPVNLDFYSSQWFAEALCHFIYNGKPVDIVLVLKIQQDADGGTKWVITSARSTYIPTQNIHSMLVPAKTGSRFLNPMSHATNFMSLSNAFNDKSHITDYLDSNFLEYPSSVAFLQALLKNQLNYQFVKKITYHFLQVDGWIFTVNRFTRTSVNSGWLISKLMKVSVEEKLRYKLALLTNSSKGL